MTKLSNQDVAIQYRSATPQDGAAIWRMIGEAGTLELNSAYFYLVFATDFGDTCLVAESEGKVVGAIVGYRPPREPEAAFVWQIGVAPSMRGRGLGKTMLMRWLELPGVSNARWMTATISDDNEASRRLFESAARELGVGCDVLPHFTEELFPADHPAEPIYRIGPLPESRPCALLRSA